MTPLLHELEKTARVIFLERSPSFQYMALFLCQLMEAVEWGRYIGA
jgi:hypothetical protein